MATRTLLGLLLGLVLASAVTFADTVTLNPDHPDRYVVQKGDTLWDISAHFLRDPWLWPEVWHINPQIENPHLIFPGDIIALSYDAQGRPMLTVQRGSTVRLSPQIRESQLERAIPTIPLKEIGPFLNRPQVVSKTELNAAPYVVAGPENRNLAAEGDRVYVRALSQEDGQSHSIYRLGEPYRNPENKKDILGYETVFIAEGIVQRFGDPATITVGDVTREVRIGDRVLPATDVKIDSSFLPRAPEQHVEGYILSVLDGIRQIGRYNVVAISLGKQDGMEVGHVLEIWQAGVTVNDPVKGRRARTALPGQGGQVSSRANRVTLPDEKAGELMIFRTFDRVSYALVMRATSNITIHDKVKTPAS